jgi:Tfp pilus assembly protein PilX
LSSVLAMIYLTLMAALAVGFYSAVDTGSSISDNEQYMHRALTSAETAMAYARYQLAHVSVPGTTTYGNLLTKLNQALQTNLTGPNAPGLSGSTIYIPAEVGGAPAWMSTDSLGGQAYIQITQPSGSSYNVQVAVVGQNANSHNTPITRTLQMLFNSNYGSAPATTPPLFNYGMVSYGEIFLNANVKVTGSNGGVMAVVNSGNPIQDNSSGSIAGNFYWTDSVAESSITWGSLSVDGYLPTSGQFINHVFGNQTAPTALSFDTSPFATYVTAQTPASNATTITNASLASGSHTFNSPLTINGVLYLQKGATVTFNSTVTVNGAIVQANNATTSSGATITFNGAVTQNSISTLGSGYTAGEKALTGTFLLLPAGSVIVNAAVHATDSVITDGLTANANMTVSSGSVINLGTGNMTFNSASTLNVTTSAATTPPAGVTGVLGPFQYNSVNLSTYQE